MFASPRRRMQTTHLKCSTHQTETHTFNRCLFRRAKIKRSVKEWSPLTWVSLLLLNWPSRSRIIIQWLSRYITRIRASNMRCSAMWSSRETETVTLTDVMLTNKWCSSMDCHLSLSQSMVLRMRTMWRMENRQLRTTILNRSVWFVLLRRRIL